MDEALERLGILDEAEVEERLVPEARVEKMQDGVLGSTDVKVDRQRLRSSDR